MTVAVKAVLIVVILAILLSGATGHQLAGPPSRRHRMLHIARMILWTIGLVTMLGVVGVELARSWRAVF